MPAKTYDPKQFATICGAFELSGFADGSFVNIEYDEDDWGLYMGTDGGGTRSKSNNHSATITIRLAQSSDSNAILDAFRKSDQFANAGQFPFLAKDNSGTSWYSAESMWIQKPPSADYDRDVTDREWTLRTDNLQSSYGGN